MLLLPKQSYGEATIWSRPTLTACFMHTMDTHYLYMCACAYGAFGKGNGKGREFCHASQKFVQREVQHQHIVAMAEMLWRSKLRENYVKLMQDLGDHDTLCAVLEQGNVLSAENTDTILSCPTRILKTRELVGLVKSRIRRGYPLFCTGLEITKQLELLALLGEQPNVKPESDEDNTNEECLVCKDNEARVAFGPCGHIATCEACSDRIQDNCPYCRTAIESRIFTYRTCQR